MRLKFLTLLVPIIFLTITSSGQIKLGSILQDNMVIQQKKPLNIWGKAIPGAMITISPDWAKPVKTKVAEDSTFSAIVKVPSAKPGDYDQHQIEITDGKNATTLRNLLIGEVWVCGGQSNMAFKVKELLNSKQEISESNNPSVRFLTVGFYWAGQPLDHFTGSWQICTPQTTPEFSAIGYYFAKEIQNKLKVPVGIISSNVGGSSAQGWVPRAFLENDKELNSTYLKGFLESKRYREPIDGIFSWDRISSPYILFNGMISPLRKLSIAGFLWYQGESNGKERESYTNVTSALIKGWRETFNQGNLPFYYVQIAPYNYDNQKEDANDYAFFREQQQNIRKVTNTGMVSTLDVGEINDIHPKNKKAVADRLSRMALNQTYGYNTIHYKSPVFSNVTYSDDSAVVSFDKKTVNQGLDTKDGMAPKYFMLAGDDQIFHQASARILNNKIILHSNKVSKPVAVRYAFTNYPITNLQTKDGLPVEQFRTDNWPENRPPYRYEFKPILVNGEKP
ncbi:sialate O-acetylesterase [Pedobacter sandarakinus]|uniref:sialate O-acetylesterase n=1 Tax=Pedobacter sandarakinus TaxID=353156 RepID=UPI002246AD91|nr:sialate O-acetylesterase [Pedobacter sandarakinus]MCX2574119.1 sialate O-acetylesterase [Pedobacter sandarakinus]